MPDTGHDAARQAVRAFSPCPQALRRHIATRSIIGFSIAEKIKSG